jgi:phosphosulfolactate phosphohydrolase-like enzyme
VIDALQQLGQVDLDNDLARVATRLFDSCKDSLPAVLSDTYGGHNIRRVHLDADIVFAARLNVLDAVGRVVDGPLRVVRL